MVKRKIALSIAAFFVFCVFGSFACFAQAVPRTQVEPSYEIVLQTLVGSNNSSKIDVPQALSGVLKKLRTNYA